jgi:hypothetical protein
MLISNVLQNCIVASFIDKAIDYDHKQINIVADAVKERSHSADRSSSFGLSPLYRLPPCIQQSPDKTEKLLKQDVECNLSIDFRQPNLRIGTRRFSIRLQIWDFGYETNQPIQMEQGKDIKLEEQ